MTIKNITRVQLEAALARTNARHDYSLRWKDGIKSLNDAGTRHQCALRSSMSRIRGARTSWSGRASVAASWHAHGHFFELVLEVAPDAVIRTGLYGERIISKAGGNWQDGNVGSAVCPVMLSELSVL